MTLSPTERYSIASVCARVPSAIVCLLSALQVYEIGTQVPHQVWVAIAHKAKPPVLTKKGVRLLRFSGAAWTHGIDETTFEGVPARITSPARTIVDCFRFERLVGREAAIEALKESLQDRKVTTDALVRVLESPALTSSEHNTGVWCTVSPDVAASIRDRLLRRAKSESVDFQLFLDRYACESGLFSAQYAPAFFLTSLSR